MEEIENSDYKTFIIR